MKRDEPTAVVGAPLLTLADAGVRFGSVQALSGIHLTLHRGERLALVGANGAGKTTLLRLLHGLVAGSGRTEHGASGQPLVAAMLFQRPFLLHLSVRRNVLVALWLRKVPKAERAARCERALARVGLGALADRPARSLSGGQQQRLASRVCYLDAGRIAVDLPCGRFFDPLQPPAAAATFLKGELPWA